MAIIRVQIDGDGLTARRLADYSYILEVLYWLSLLHDDRGLRALLGPVDSLSDLPDRWQRLEEEQDRNVTYELPVRAIRMNSPLLLELVVPGGGLTLLGLLRMVRDWTETRRRAKLMNDREEILNHHLRERLQRYADEDGLPKEIEQVVAELAQVSTLPVTEVSIDEAPDPGEGEGRATA